MRAAKTPHAKMVGRKKPSMTLYLRLGGTRRTFHLTAVQPGDSIRDIKADIELVAGIPAHILRLSFLDEGDLHDDSTVNDNYIVTGATLDLRVWDHWQLLMTIASKGDSETIFNLGVTKTSSYKSSYTDYMNEVDRQDWFAQRGFVALFIACHRGHYGLAQRLINAGVDVNCATKLGRRPLHAAACQNNYKIVNLLLLNGADIAAADIFGKTPLGIATDCGNKSVARHLFLYCWQQRATSGRKECPQRESQMAPSDFLQPVWKP